MLYLSDFDEQRTISLASIIKNRGFFKSEKQAKFLSKSLHDKEAQNWHIEKFMLENFPEAEYAVSVTGTYIWANYGARSKIPVAFGYAMDKFGVVAKVKIPYSGNLKIGASADYTRTTLEFARDPALTVPDYLIETVKEVPPEEQTNHVGVVGERMDFVATVVAVRHYESGFKMHYRDSGMRTIVTLKTEAGDILTHFGTNFTEVGNTFKFTAKIKEHSIYEGKKKTVITRPTKVENITNDEVVV